MEKNEFNWVEEFLSLRQRASDMWVKSILILEGSPRPVHY